MSRFCDTTTEMGVHSRYLCKFRLDHGQNTEMIGIILNHVCSFHKLEYKMLIESQKTGFGNYLCSILFKNIVHFS